MPMSEHSLAHLPSHVAVILDGNRRFAKKLMLKPWKGHEWGKKKVQALLEWCYELGLKELTLYAFSSQNFNRPKEEFDYLMKIFRDAYGELIDDPKIDEHKVKIRFIGETKKFPKDVQELMKKVVERTKKYSNFMLNVAMGYGGKEEILYAVKKVARKIQDGLIKADDININMLNQEMYIQSEPDMVIRTGGERRTSNFLMWQSSYSEWFFVDKPWPEFEKEDFLSCIEEFSQRERRFGK